MPWRTLCMNRGVKGRSEAQTLSLSIKYFFEFDGQLVATLPREPVRWRHLRAATHLAPRAPAGLAAPRRPRRAAPAASPPSRRPRVACPRCQHHSQPHRCVAAFGARRAHAVPALPGSCLVVIQVKKKHSPKAGGATRNLRFYYKSHEIDRVRKPVREGESALDVVVGSQTRSE